MIIPALIAMLIDQAQDRARRGRLHELRGRLGLLQPVPVVDPVFAKMLRVYRQEGPHVYWVLVGWLLDEGMQAGGRPTTPHERALVGEVWKVGPPPTVSFDERPGIAAAIPWLAKEVRLWMAIMHPERGLEGTLYPQGGPGMSSSAAWRRAFTEEWHGRQDPRLDEGERWGRRNWRRIKAEIDRYLRGFGGQNNAALWEGDFRGLVSVLDWVHAANPALPLTPATGEGSVRYIDLSPLIDAHNADQLPYELEPATPRPGQVVFDIEGPDRELFTLQLLNTRRLLEQESRVLDHCVGHSNQPYIGWVREGRVRIYSFRDGDGDPMVTFELKVDDDGSPGLLVQAKGFRDEMPPNLSFPGRVWDVYDREAFYQALYAAAQHIQPDTDKWRAEVDSLRLWGDNVDLVKLVEEKASYLEQGDRFSESLYDRLKGYPDGDYVYEGFEAWAKAMITGDAGSWQPPEVASTQIYDLLYPEPTAEDIAEGRVTVINEHRSIGPRKLPAWVKPLEDYERNNERDEFVPLFGALQVTVPTARGELEVVADVFIGPTWDGYYRDVSFKGIVRAGARLTAPSGQQWTTELYEDIVEHPWHQVVLKPTRYAPEREEIDHGKVEQLLEKEKHATWSDNQLLEVVDLLEDEIDKALHDDVLYLTGPGAPDQHIGGLVDLSSIGVLLLGGTGGAEYRAELEAEEQAREARRQAEAERAPGLPFPPRGER